MEVVNRNVLGGAAGLAHRIGRVHTQAQRPARVGHHRVFVQFLGQPDRLGLLPEQVDDRRAVQAEAVLAHRLLQPRGALGAAEAAQVQADVDRAVEAAELEPDHVDEQELLRRSEEHTSELQSLMRISYAVFCLKKKNTHKKKTFDTHNPNTDYRK